MLSRLKPVIADNLRDPNSRQKVTVLNRSPAVSPQTAPRKGRSAACLSKAFTLVEVVISLAIAATVIAGIVTGYINCVYRAEWLACSAAAQSQASQRLEQVRAARWDTMASPPLDEVASNQFPVLIQSLDLPRSGDKVILATNRTFITVISEDPPVRLIRVECIWKFPSRGVYTNSLVSYRCPEQ
jgi:type II secretory pathway pseudopilin PulG